jgi:hypothetical protein
LNLVYDRPWLYPKQLEAIFNPLDYEGNAARISLIEASTKTGKAQPLDAMVWTPLGPVAMGEVEVGMHVLTADGGRARVTAIYPQGMRDVYKCTFADGTVVEADDEHLWEVDDYRQRQRLWTTQQLRSQPNWRLYRTSVPRTQPVDFDEQPVPLDPYLVGVLIGDGGLKYDSVVLSSADEYILDRVAAVLPDGHELRYAEQYDWRLSAGRGAAALRERGATLMSMIRALGLHGCGSREKFIPELYKRNSMHVRREVLRGIMDTDGWVSKKYGEPCIGQSSARLAADITELVQSLGGTALPAQRVNRFGIEYRLILRNLRPEEVFALPRKLILARMKAKTGRRMFRSIEFSRRAFCQCIEIAHPRHLYLTDGFVPTHNTVGCICWLYEKALLEGVRGRNYWWVAPVFGQAEIAFNRTKQMASPATIDSIHHGDLRIRLMNGASMHYLSGEKPDNLYGEDVHAGVLDEASRMREETWYAVRSTLTATQGPLRIIGNVKGRQNWFYRMSRKAESGWKGRAYYKIIAADAVKQGVLSADEIEQARTDMPEAVFRELYLAEASDDEGNPFGAAHIRACVAPMSQLPPVAWGWDLAKGGKQLSDGTRSGDWTVGIGLDRHGAVCGFHRFQMPWKETIQRIHEATRDTPACVDATGLGDMVVETLQRDFVGNYEGFKYTSPSKQMVMEGLAVAIQSGEVSFPEGPIALELESFEYQYTRTGVLYSAPVGMHDDCVCALAQAVRCRAQNRGLEVWENLGRQATVARAPQTPVQRAAVVSRFG